ncbi:hypothetical protein, partial [Rugamonas violacea]|uniref:hypothetical protein n=1 Tax=Rugamonas sp. CCM 8940 TaxID=2765359 RepID=UPI001F274782
MISIITKINWLNILPCSIIALSPLFPSKEIDLARSRSGLFFGSSRFAGEGILDFEEEVCGVPETVSHPLDDF